MAIQRRHQIMFSTYGYVSTIDFTFCHVYHCCQHFVFIHLAGSFRWTGAPMAWSIIGMAMLRIVHRDFLLSILAIVPICDDFVGFGHHHHCVTASLFVRNLIVGVCGPNSVSLDKSILAQQVEVIGWLADLTATTVATIAPKYDAIDKMTYFFFSFNINIVQPLIIWQILHSFADRYSHGLRRLRPFVSCFAHHMIRSTGTGHHIATDVSKLYVIKQRYSPKTVASASTKFAIEMWRLICVLLFYRKDWFSIPIEQYIAMNGASKTAIRYRSVSDESQSRICSAFYCNTTKLLYAADDENRYQMHREYLEIRCASSDSIKLQ